MARFQQLFVYQTALSQLRSIATLTSDVRFGDLSNQLRRAGISVVSNIAEGAGRGSDRDLIRFLCIARGSNDEIAAQLDILAALRATDVTTLQATNASVGRMLSGFIRRLRSVG